MKESQSLHLSHTHHTKYNGSEMFLLLVVIIHSDDRIVHKDIVIS